MFYGKQSSENESEMVICKMEKNGSISLAPPNKAHISVTRQCSVRSWWNLERGLKPSCLRGDSIPDLSQQSRSTHLSGRFNPTAKINVLNPSTKQTHITKPVLNSNERFSAIARRKIYLPPVFLRFFWRSTNEISK